MTIYFSTVSNLPHVISAEHKEPLVYSSPGWSIDTTVKAQGEASLKCVDAAGQVGGPQIMSSSTVLANTIWCEQGSLRFHTAPAVETPLACALSGASVLTASVGTDRKVRIVSGTGSTLTGLSSWSSSALSVDTFYHLALFYDPLSVPGKVVIVLKVDDVEWCSCIVNAQTWGTSFLGASHAEFAANWTCYFDDWACLISTSAADAPHLVNWPKVVTDCSWPKADKAGNTFTPSAAVDHYTLTNDGVDGDTGHDGDATYIWASVVSKVENETMQTPSDMGWDANAVLLTASSGTIGPLMSYVTKKSGSGTKFHGHVALTGATEVVGSYGSDSYNQQRLLMAKASGTWSKADFTGTWYVGFLIGADNNDIVWLITEMYVLFVYYYQTLGLTSGPMIPQGGLF